MYNLRARSERKQNLESRAGKSRAVIGPSPSILSLQGEGKNSKPVMQRSPFWEGSKAESYTKVSLQERNPGFFAAAALE